MYMFETERNGKREPEWDMYLSIYASRYTYMPCVCHMHTPAHTQRGRERLSQQRQLLEGS